MVVPAPVAALQRFLIVSRAHFLAGGMLHYAVGAAVVWYQTGSLSLPALAAGQAIVTLSQLMTHYLNEYWDQEVDALSRRTFFSGGSGAIQAQLVRAALVYRAGLACALAAIGLTLALWLGGLAPVSLVALVAVVLLGAAGYSSPPLRLVSRGLGELTAALIVALATPLVAYVLQAGAGSTLLVLACLPLVAIMFAMVLGVEFPDYEADRQTGKRNLVVRLGLRRAALLHHAMLAAAYLLALAGAQLGLPRPVALLLLLQTPLAALQILRASWLAHSGQVDDPLAPFTAVALTATAAALTLAGFIQAGAG